MAIFITDEQQLKILNEASKKEVETKLKRRSESLFLHLLKLYYWGYDEYIKRYWIKEISNMYIDVSKLPNNKYPSKENIEKLIWENNDLENLARILNKDKNYSKYPNIKIDYNAKEFCIKYVEWLSEALSLNGKIDNTDAQDFLLDLYNEYN